MSKLINYGLGEVCDRLSLLALRICYGELAGTDVSAFKTERNALLPKLLAREHGRWLEHWSDLAAVRAALWLYESDLREYKATGQTADNTNQIVECAFRIQELEDRRETLIESINSFVGDRVLEKV